jgi:5'-deoxynucleotidase YfbR-like HD superfamily hydrolase
VNYVVGINSIYKSGSVTRWHANPDVPAQTLADHHGRVAQIILYFFPAASVNLLYAALHHDCGELIVGDVPSPAKRDDQLAHFLQLREAIARQEMGIDVIDHHDPRLTFADKLEAYTYAAHTRPDIMGQAEWVRALSDLGEMSDALNVSEKLVQWFKQ